MGVALIPLGVNITATGAQAAVNLPEGIRAFTLYLLGTIGTGFNSQLQVSSDASATFVVLRTTYTPASNGFRAVNQIGARPLVVTAARVQWNITAGTGFTLSAYLAYQPLLFRQARDRQGSRMATFP